MRYPRYLAFSKIFVVKIIIADKSDFASIRGEGCMHLFAAFKQFLHFAGGKVIHIIPFACRMPVDGLHAGFQ